ncbi:DUF1707 domain-containing protein [Nocardioides sp. zg-1308]|uniref:DUF1707 SHOCT-like domain-containing protein n=1 Tax=Nocardioides sp. zg-1308 TaxID=2736253 RepID=UPI0015528591|nr:DUF1707 domain-containing protein [Nocardioides sp. zg-1308]NPD03508.1 DUF1707 domain-containing protein [Nocardioides sp. zg-1308]
MSGLRAKDADRDRFVELIEAAYVDGQLGTEDRELRVSRALAAETLGELETLTHDLQRPSDRRAGTVAAGTVATGPVRAERRPRQPGACAAVLLVLAVITAFTGGLAALILLLVAWDPGPDPATPSGAAGPARPGTADEASGETATFEMTAAHVRELVRSYETEFGTLDTYEVGLYPERAYTQVPVRGSRARSEDWSWEGAWHQDSDASAVGGLYEVLDLGELDVRRLFANIALAERTLDVPGGELTHVLVHRWTDEAPDVSIHVANEFEESGFLRTTLSGDVVASHPFEP